MSKKNDYQYLIISDRSGEVHRRLSREQLSEVVSNEIEEGASLDDLLIAIEAEFKLSIIVGVEDEV